MALFQCHGTPRDISANIWILIFVGCGRWCSGISLVAAGQLIWPPMCVLVIDACCTSLPNNPRPRSVGYSPLSICFCGGQSLARIWRGRVFLLCALLSQFRCAKRLSQVLILVGVGCWRSGTSLVAAGQLIWPPMIYLVIDAGCTGLPNNTRRVW